MRMHELIDKWTVVGELITLQNNYTFFKNEWDAERLYREIAKLEMKIGKTQGLQVVRCKNCKYCRTFYPVKEIGKEAIQVWYCDLYRCNRKPDEFCSDGERREGE